MLVATLTFSHFVVIVTVVVRRQEILTWSQRGETRTTNAKLQLRRLRRGRRIQRVVDRPPRLAMVVL